MSDRMTPERLEEIGELADKYLITTEHVVELLMELHAVTAERGILVAYAQGIVRNYDHDSDAHRYGTSCRVCDAEHVLRQLAREWP
jgi:hypothetical protein